jgi:D-amino peptidase
MCRKALTIEKPVRTGFPRLRVSKSFQSVLIIADIEGSSGCWSYSAGRFMTEEWYTACIQMTLDVNMVVTGLFDAGVRKVTVHDFHRTGYNLLPELIDSRARVISGYRHGPVPGIGNPRMAEAALFLGMHAASGSSGFLPHTLTSRIQRLEVNEKAMSEVELFSASLAPYGVRPVFFSGCPVACAEAKEMIKGIKCYPIDKTQGQKEFHVDAWRAGLKRAAIQSLDNVAMEPYLLKGPFKAVVTMRDGEKPAQKIARRWDFDCEGARILLAASDFDKLYRDLIRLCYLTPLIERVVPLALLLHRLQGYIGLTMVRRHARRAWPESP